MNPTPPVQLVTAHDEVGAALYRRRPLPPAGVAVVCLLADGRLVPVHEVSMGRYRRRYDVNIADHFHSETVALPARDDAFEFQGAMDIGWRVTDPVKVVARNVLDGLALVRSSLLAQMRQISRRYPVELCAEADDEVNRVLGMGLELPEGITVHRFAARLTLDSSTRELMQQRRNTGYESEIEQRKIDATRRALNGDNALLLLHLTRHKEDTASLINMIVQDRNTTEQRRAETLRDLLDRKIIQDTDLDEYSRALIQQSTAVLGGPVGPPQLTGAPASGSFPVLNMAPAEAPAAPPAQQPGNGSTGGVTGWKSVGKTS